MASSQSMSRYEGANVLTPIVKAVLSRNRARISRWASEKCQKGAGGAHALSECGCMSAAEKLNCKELSIMFAVVELIETGEKGAKKDAGQKDVPGAAACIGCDWLGRDTLLAIGTVVSLLNQDAPVSSGSWSEWLDRESIQRCAVSALKSMTCSCGADCTKSTWKDP
jgi:hypothetical protein